MIVKGQLKEEAKQMKKESEKGGDEGGGWLGIDVRQSLSFTSLSVAGYETRSA